MKCALIIAGKIRQVMLTPENDGEAQILKAFTVDDDITLDVKQGHLFDSSPKSAEGYSIDECKGGYLRAFEDGRSLMLVLRPKKEELPP